MGVLFGPGCTLGLTRGGREIADPGYARQPVTFSEPDDEATVRSTADVFFGPWQSADAQRITGWLVARGDLVIDLGEFAPQEIRERPRLMDEQVVRAGMLTVRWLAA